MYLFVVAWRSPARQIKAQAPAFHKESVPGPWRDAQQFCFQLHEYYTSCSKDCKDRFDLWLFPAILFWGHLGKSIPSSACLAVLQPSWHAGTSWLPVVSMRKQFCAVYKDLESMLSACVTGWSADSCLPSFSSASAFSLRQESGSGCCPGWILSALLTSPFSAEE